MGRVLILGGGFGGVSTAHHIRMLGPEHDITLVSRSTRFMMGFRKNSELAGSAPMDEGRRPLAALEERGVRLVHGTVTKVDPEARAAEVDGERLEADAMVIALGAETAPDAVRGLLDHGHDVYDDADVPAAAEALASLNQGRVVIGIFGAPYRCPPGPYELALLASESARARGANLEFSVFTPQPMSLPVLGTAGCEVVEGRLGLRGIGFTANAKTERVEPDRVVLADGKEIAFDLLLAIPPHRCPQVLVEAGLAEPGGWVKVNAATLETGAEGVSAIGDCTAIPLATGQPLPKAGVLAESEGRVVAERIVAKLNGIRPEAEFDGEGACYLEIGGGEAMMVRGRFLAQPAPQVELVGPSAELLEEKAGYERTRLAEWFDAA
ncbi:MAG: NAD(P)/FAD-dependent oxidoreductase [Actinomycetota bacterium]|nr:NAD(P)/FAD-dependent oxidoreductase [Actinomycetota bacterium]